MTRHPVTVLGALGLAAFTAGCLGSATPHAPAPRPPLTRVVVRFPVGGESGRRHDLARSRCPRFARCRAGRVPGTRHWSLFAARVLACAPARGGYRDPAAACHALSDVLRRGQHPSDMVCACARPSILDRTIAGTYGGRRVSEAFGTCCLGARVSADLRVLTRT